MPLRRTVVLVGCEPAFFEHAERGGWGDGFEARTASDLSGVLEVLGKDAVAAVLIHARLGKAKVAMVAADARVLVPSAALVLVGFEPTAGSDPLGEGFDDVVVAATTCDELMWRVRLRVAAASRNADLLTHARKLSHDVRGPLAVVLGQVELIEAGLVEAAQLPQMAATLRRQAARIAAVLDPFAAG